jgi:selenocysteine lyase/cysteine desulfurase
VKRLQPQPKFQIHTSLDPALSCAIATVGIEGIPPAQITSKLWEKWRIIATPISHAEYQGIRVTPNVYTTLDEVDAFGDAMEALAKGA